MTVEIEKPISLIGRSTMESIQSGLFYSALCSIEGIVKRVKAELKENGSVVTLGTGGMASLMKDERVFDYFLPNLVLEGLKIAEELNRGN
jgi:type III pantothenate kinase